MNYLAIDTSGKNLTVVIKKGDKTYMVYDENCGVKHSTALMPCVEELCLKANFDIKDADFLVAVVGAGSFTGIRIGVSTVKAMCFAFNKPCLAVTSFDTLAYNKKGGKVLSVIDAKHDGFYVCGYDEGKVVLEPSYIMRSEVEKLLDEYDGVAETEIKGLSVTPVSVVDGLINAIECKIDCVTNNVEALTPLYVRKSQAEEGR